MEIPESMSPSALEGLLACPRRWHLHRLLRRKDPLPPPAELDPGTPMDRGDWMHRVLQAWAEQSRGEPLGRAARGLLGASDEEWRSRLERALGDALEDGGAPPPGEIRALARAEVRRRTERILRALEAAHPEARILEAERSLEGEARHGFPRRWSGRLDLLLETEEGRLVVDFKWGSAPKGKPKYFHLQPWIYPSLAGAAAMSATSAAASKGHAHGEPAEGTALRPRVTNCVTLAAFLDRCRVFHVVVGLVVARGPCGGHAGAVGRNWRRGGTEAQRCRSSRQYRAFRAMNPSLHHLARALLTSPAGARRMQGRRAVGSVALSAREKEAIGC